MRADFRPLTQTTIGRVLPLMEKLYAQDSLPFDRDRAHRGCEWLLQNPGLGAIWMIEAEAVAIGYLVVTVCVSLEFHGQFALLDELYIEAPWRGRGMGGQAIDFAAGWARSRGFSALRLEIAHENAHGLHVYRKSGFDLHDRHIMTKWL